MKILWLSPHLDSEHPLARTLASRGVALFVCRDADEASSLMLVHGRTVDLAIVHREGLTGPDDGLGWIEKIKTDPAQSDLPILLTADGWGDSDFAQHQASPYGCNAYLRWPATEEQLLGVIQSIFPGENLSSESTSVRPATSISSEPTAGIKLSSLGSKPSPPPGPPSMALPSLEPLSEAEPSLVMQPIMEAGRALSLPATDSDGLTLSFQLDAPESELGAIGVPAETPVAAESAFVGTSLDLAALTSAGGTAVKLTHNAYPGEAAPAISSEPEPVLGDLPGQGTGIIWTTPQTPPESLVPESPSPSPLGSPDAEALALATAPVAPPDPVQDLAADPEVAAEMPYLFSGTGSVGSRLQGFSAQAPAAPFGFVQALGDAVVPGGAAQAPDVETLKKYLLLREQDVAVLSGQLKASQDQVAALEQQLRLEHGRATELTLAIEEQKRRIDDFDREKARYEESAANEVNDCRFQLKARGDKVRALESQVRETSSEIERLKERVRGDIRKIRVREKELENRLEILKKDSEALIVARENKIVELKRRIDLLEFNMDLLQDQFSREKETSGRLRERLARAAQVVRVAGGLLDAQAASALSQAVEGEATPVGEESSEETGKKAS